MSFSIGDTVRVLDTPWVGVVKHIDGDLQVLMLDVWREHGPFEEVEDAPYCFDEVEKVTSHIHRWSSSEPGVLTCACGSKLSSHMVER